MKAITNPFLCLILVVSLLGFFVRPATALPKVDFSQKHWYVGGGINHNSLDTFDDAFGAQVFAGLDLPYSFHPQVTTHAEVGVMTTDDFESPTGNTDHTGLWTTGVAKINITPEFRGLARLGFDFGDDDGLMAGAGGEVDLAREWFLRGEYVSRDDIGSLQVNLGYHF